MGTKSRRATGAGSVHGCDHCGGGGYSARCGQTHGTEVCADAFCGILLAAGWQLDALLHFRSTDGHEELEGSQRGSAQKCTPLLAARARDNKRLLVLLLLLFIQEIHCIKPSSWLLCFWMHTAHNNNNNNIMR